MIEEFSAGGALLHEFNGELKVLLIRVRKDNFELPKGHVEKGEMAEETALREIKEETGLNSSIQALVKLDSISYEFESEKGVIRKSVEYFLFEANELPQFAAKPKATRELRWVTEDELEKLPLVNEKLRSICLKAFSLFRNK